jgi:uncharacterized protein
MYKFVRNQNYKITAAGLISGLLMILLGYAYFIEPSRLVVNGYDVRVRNWNSDCDGLKIVAVSDIHGGSNGVTEEKIRRVVERVNNENADLVFLLGDYVSEYSEGSKQLKMPMEAVARNLRGLTAKYGVFAVLGNHDGRYGDAEIRSELEHAGIKVFENDGTTIMFNGWPIRLVGMEDHLKITTWEEFRSLTRNAIAQSGPAGDVILLEHSPDILPIITGGNAVSPDLRLILAGHTHGGQVWFPIIGRPIVPSSYGQKYAAGHVRENDVDLFVTTGVGESVLPFRFMVPPEIAVLTIYRD